MSALVETQSLEAEIMDCCRAIYCATDPDIAMSNWVRLRMLTAQRTAAEREQFIRESLNRDTTP
jgi:hypothetical protein